MLKMVAERGTIVIGWYQVFAGSVSQTLNISDDVTISGNSGVSKTEFSRILIPARKEESTGCVKPMSLCLTFLSRLNAKNHLFKLSWDRHSKSALRTISSEYALGPDNHSASCVNATEIVG
jgi:hypothetical protein